MKKILSIVAAVLFAGSLLAAEFVKTPFASIKSTDEVIITATKSDVVYALVNSKANGAKPAAQEIAVVSDKISTDADTLQWNIVTVEDSLVLYPAGQTTIWLSYLKSSNDLRVKSDNKLFGFEYDAEKKCLKVKSLAENDGLYVALNTAATQWGHYKTAKELTFFVKTPATSIDNNALQTKAVKMIENGRLVIIKNGVKYDALGAIIQ